MELPNFKGSRSTLPERRLEMRSFLWPDLTPDEIWDRTEKRRTKGFGTIPRTIPLFMNIIDYLSDKGQPCSRPYLALWCRVYDESFLEIKTPSEMAFESGYVGQRAVSTWQSKMRKLKELKFIDSRGGISGEFHYVLLRNPYLAAEELYKSKEHNIPDDQYRNLLSRKQEIGAIDLTEGWYVSAPASEDEKASKPKRRRKRKANVKKKS